VASKVTFIIPVFNAGHYLSHSVGSVFAQVRDDWQLILIDDASSDGSRERMAEFNSPKVTCLYNERNAGLYASLDKAVSYVATDWTAILHQDDELYSNYLEELLVLLSRYPGVDGVWAEQDVIDANGESIKNRKNTGKIELIGPGREPWLSGLQRGCYWIGSGSMTRTPLLTAMQFRSDLPHCADYDWFLRAVRTSCFLYYEKPLMRLRQHATQASAQNIATGRDIREYWSVIAENVASHGSEISPRERVAIARHWMVVVGRRAAAAAWRGRWRYAGWLATSALRFLLLPLLMSRSAARNGPG
jgi:glycosyltransferase involved in cell wall biosynthesis